MLGFMDTIRQKAAAVKAYPNMKDFVEGVAGLGAMVAKADGEISDKEVSTLLEGIKTHPAVAGSGFPSRKIEEIVDIQLNRAGSFSGRVVILRDLEEVRGRCQDGTMCTDIVAVAVDVADKCGGIGDKELEAIRKGADKLKVNLKDIGLD